MSHWCKLDSFTELDYKDPRTRAFKFGYGNLMFKPAVLETTKTYDVSKSIQKELKVRQGIVGYGLLVKHGNRRDDTIIKYFAFVIDDAKIDRRKKL